jgi:hypothetical protein
MKSAINITIEGLENDEHYALVFHASYFFLSQLLPRTKTLSIDIIFDPIDEYDGFVERLTKRHYEVTIHPKQSVWQSIRSIAHEFVHIKQYEKRRLVDDKDAYGIIWKGKLYEYDKEFDGIPWEDEAFRIESELYYYWLMYK